MAGIAVLVFAAASLTDASKEIAAGWEKAGGEKIVFNFGASSTLARQIREGAPADLFLSADEAQMDGLEKAGLLASGTRKSILSNSLVVIVPADSSLQVSSARDLTAGNVGRIAVADPAIVPAGTYARDYLTRVGVWAALSAKIVPTENVRGALAAVESGNVDAGIVYRTDAAISKKVKTAWEIPRKDGPSISYPFAALQDSPRPEAARRLLDHLSSKAAREVFVRHGFLLKD
jgi:molybdate transport system substrate-binding protein